MGLRERWITGLNESAARLTPADRQQQGEGRIHRGDKALLLHDSFPDRARAGCWGVLLNPATDKYFEAPSVRTDKT